jgi:hypothetical protein
VPTVPELDALAEEHDVADYPADGLKAEKVAALEAVGVDFDAEPDPMYHFRLKDDVEGGVASFMAEGKAIELNADSPDFETADRSVALGLRGVWFLEEVMA